MSQSGSYYLIGPIAANSQTVLTYATDSVSYFLTLVKGQNGGPDDLIFDPRPQGDQNTISAPLIVTPLSGGTNGTNYSLSYTDSNNTTVYITGIKSNNNYYAGPSSSQVALTLQQNSVNPWPGVPFLAGVGYTFSFGNNNVIQWKTYEADQSEGGMALTIKMKDNQPVISSYTGSIRAIISPWYIGGQCDCVTSGAEAIVTIEEDWVAGQSQITGFTTAEDCQVGVQYSYCPPKQSCGDNCRGPCPSSSLAGATSTASNIGCFYNSSQDKFVCEEDPFNEPWYQEPWFIYGAIVVAILIVILFVFLLARFSDKKN